MGRTSRDHLWLSHHWADDYGRCVTVRGRHVCKRCLVLYPTVLAVAAIANFVLGPGLLAILLMWSMPIPMVVEWVLEHRGTIRYSQSRQTILSAIAGVGGGVALGLHLQDPFVAVAVWPMATVAAVCLVSALVSRRTPPAEDTDWLELHEEAEARRRSDLASLADSASSKN